MNCGSPFVRISLFCDTCEKKYTNSIEKTHLETDSRFEFEYLFPWVPNENPTVSRLLTHLKGSNRKTSWSYYGELFSRKRSVEKKLLAKRIFITPPSANSKPDHAFYWGKSLSSIYQAPLLSYDLIKKSEGPSQKTLNRSSRQKIEFYVKDLNRLIKEYPYNEYEYVFCDDIWTTGSTAQAAHCALGQPTHFRVWVLSKRCEFGFKNRNGRGGPKSVIGRT